MFCRATTRLRAVVRFNRRTFASKPSLPSQQQPLLTGMHHIAALRQTALSRQTAFRRAPVPPRTNSSHALTTLSAAATANLASSSIATTTTTAIPHKAIASWLFGCAGMVFGMVGVGGYTRLSRSGLSMTDWKVTGSLPPLNEAEWEVEFAKYRNFPEYKRLNMSMTTEEFKSIFYWEWGHRMWGRAIGVVFVAPLVYFAARRQIPTNSYGRLALLMGMGAGQGLIGWWMVRSGLEHTHVFGIERSPDDQPRVSPYRLTTHLSMAFVTYGLLSWTAMDMWRKAGAAHISDAALAARAAMPIGKKIKRLRIASAVVAGILGVTVLSGGFVAGNDAGRAYNDFPLMAGEWIPEDIWNSDLGVRNFFENTATVQFDHRILATTTVASVAAIILMARQPGVWSRLPSEARAAILTLGGLVVGQYALGVTALINYVPVELGVAHQIGALSTWTTAVVLMNTLKHVR